MLQSVLDGVMADLDALATVPSPALRSTDVGEVLQIGHGIARVRGLPSIGSEEIVRFPGGVLGVAINLEPTEVGVMLLGDSEALTAGVDVRATGREADTPVGEPLLGRVIDATGRPLDQGTPLDATERLPIERDAPTVIERAPVTVPLQTGLKVVDALVPIGRGQRELIIGDRQTGKTTVALDAIINQRGTDVICIYCAVGQRGTAVARVIDALKRHRAFDNTIVVVASDDDPPGLRFVTPYAATTMAEYFMAQGRHVLIVYDDLTRHARAYRELSLLLRRPPGREAYPGDIFYVHSRLLERATYLRPERGGGSLTALPIVETQAQDISAYIPTNLISITDGQIYLSPTLFRKGVLPAVDVGKSVSRVGGKTQLAAFRRVSASLRLAYAQFEELEAFGRFATRLDEATRQTLRRGQRVREILKQPPNQPLSVADQVVALAAADAGLLTDIPLADIAAAERAVRERVNTELPDLCGLLGTDGSLDAAQWRVLRATSVDALSAFSREAT